MLQRKGISQLFFLFAVILITFFPLSVGAKKETVSIEDLLEDPELTTADFMRFEEQLEGKDKFQALGLNGERNYPSMISEVNAPSEVAQLAERLQFEEISEQPLREEYKEIFDSYFAYIDEDEVGNKYLFVINQPVRVIFDTNVDAINVTVDSKPTEKIKNNGYIELKKGQQYKVVVEADGYTSYTGTIDLRNVDKLTETKTVELQSSTNWGSIIVAIAIVILALVVFWVLEKRKRKTPNSLEVILTIANINISSDILKSEQQRNLITSRLKEKIGDQVRKFKIILDKIQTEIIEQKAKGFNRNIDDFEVRKSTIESNYNNKSDSINIQIDNLRGILKFSDPESEIEQIAHSMMDSYSVLGNSFLEGYQLYNEIMIYKYRENPPLIETRHNSYGLSHAEVLKMINEYASPIISTMISQIKDLQGNTAELSKSLNSISNIIKSSIEPRIQLLEKQQNKTIQEILQTRSDLEEEIRSVINNSHTKDENPEINKQFEAFKASMEEKLSKINELALENLKKYVHAELASSVEELTHKTSHNTSELLQLRKQITDEVQQLKIEQGKLGTEWIDLKREMENKIEKINESVKQQLIDFVNNDFAPRILLVEEKQHQYVVEISNLRQKIKNELQNADDKLTGELDVLWEKVENKIDDMYNSILTQLSDIFSKEQKYEEISQQIAQKINVECSPEIIHSLALGRYLYTHQKEILNDDASVVFIAYAKAVEKILNPSNDPKFKLHEAIKDQKLAHLKDDLEWIRGKRNDAAHTKKVTVEDAKRVDDRLLENNTNDGVLITKLIKAKIS